MFTTVVLIGKYMSDNSCQQLVITVTVILKQGRRQRSGIEKISMSEIVPAVVGLRINGLTHLPDCGRLRGQLPAERRELQVAFPHH